MTEQVKTTSLEEMKNLAVSGGNTGLGWRVWINVRLKGVAHVANSGRSITQ